MVSNTIAKQDILHISRMLENNKFEAEKMYEILQHYKDSLPLVRYLLDPRFIIYRASINNECQLHNTVDRLSYPPAKFARTDRASLEGKPMFYGTILTSAIKKNAYPYIVGTLETTDILRNYEAKGIVHNTISLWKMNRPLKLFAFPFSDKYSRPTAEIITQIQGWKEKMSESDYKGSSLFSKYIGDLIATQNYSCLYDITARTIDYILYESSVASSLDGVMYPSVMAAGEGMNICLKKETVDNCLKFERAILQQVYKFEGRAIVVPLAYSYFAPDRNTIAWVPSKLSMQSLLSGEFFTIK